MVARAEEQDKGEEKSLPKTIKLPFYDEEKRSEPAPPQKPSVAVATVESYVRSARLQVNGVLKKVTDFNDNVTMKWNTAKAHTNGVIDFFQNEPELWQRCGIVAVAGLTGFISGYRRTGLIKTRNMLISTGAAAAICWPKQTVDATMRGYQVVKEPTVKLWEEYSPWSPYRPVDTTFVPPSKYYSTKFKAEEDQGQANAEDKDMYSTRGS